jgi:hypothetical protein
MRSWLFELIECDPKHIPLKPEIAGVFAENFAIYDVGLAADDASGLSDRPLHRRAVDSAVDKAPLTAPQS